MICSSVNLMFLVSFKLPFNMQALRSLMLLPSALKYIRGDRNFFCLIECVITKSVSKVFACFSKIVRFRSFLAMNRIHNVIRITVIITRRHCFETNANICCSIDVFANFASVCHTDCCIKAHHQ